jgi:hypothetical protein
MKLNLNSKQARFITFSILQPYQFPLALLNNRPYTAQGKEWKKFVSLQKWVKSNLLVESETEYKKGELIKFKVKEDDQIVVGIKVGTGKDALVEVLKYYEPIGMLPEWIEAYGNLISILEEKDAQVDDFNEEINEDDEEDEEEKEKKEKDE